MKHALPQWQPPPGFAARVAAEAIAARNVYAAQVRVPAGLYLMNRLTRPVVLVAVAACVAVAVQPSWLSRPFAAENLEQHLIAIVCGCTALALAASWWISRRAFARLFAALRPRHQL